MAWQIGDQSGELKAGQLLLLRLGEEEVEAVLEPHRGHDVGEGRGRRWQGKVGGGAVGVILDGRGRPLELPSDDDVRMNQLDAWVRAVGAMPGGER